MRLFSSRCKRIHKMIKLSLGIGALVMAGLFATPTWAASPGRDNAPVNQEEGQPQTPLSKVDTTIEKKSLQHIFTLGQTFAVGRETLIVGTDGKEVTLKKMLVPCDAVVSYLVENGVPTAKRIDIKRVASGAGTQWFSERPE